MELTPSQVGSQAEFAIAAALAAAGKQVYVPLFGAHSRVDLVTEDEHGLHRVQCKTSRLRNGVIFFHTCSNTGREQKGYQGEADFFGVYSPELQEVFLVPVGEVPERGCSMRVEAARNGQIKRVRWAGDYALNPSARLPTSVPSLPLSA
jgi:PD-(D/E)XK nuclease superfamily protein